jgi:hypothetical protein
MKKQNHTKQAENLKLQNPIEILELKWPWWSISVQDEEAEHQTEITKSLQSLQGSQNTEMQFSPSVCTTDHTKQKYNSLKGACKNEIISSIICKVPKLINITK